MKPIRYTLLADGPTDRALVSVIDWKLAKITGIAERGFTSQFIAGPAELSERLRVGLVQYPCDLLFVHRDAETTDGYADRYHQIQDAVRQLTRQQPTVIVVPVRMTEAWLLTGLSEIRKAAGNPNGSVHLQLPSLENLENLPDPKDVLDALLVKASELNGRRRKKFSRPSELGWRRIRVAELTQDFSSLRQLSAFREFERQIDEVAASFG
ncbi:MAG: hypothetical protein WC058_02035 [Phycisphaeraceae bacterium]